MENNTAAYQEILAVAGRLRARMETRWPEFPRWYCHNASAALMIALQRLGFSARLVDGTYRLDSPMIIDPTDPEEEPATQASHRWVEVEGLWVDLTADQFAPYVTEPLEPVVVLPAGSTPRHVPGRPDPTPELLTDPDVLAAVDELIPPLEIPEDYGDLTRAFEAARAVGRQDWSLAWFLAAELCARFYASHGIAPRVIDFQGGYYGIKMEQIHYRTQGNRNKELGRFTMLGDVENWITGRPGDHGCPLVERAAGGEPVEFLVRDAIRHLHLPAYPGVDHATCHHRRRGASYVLLFRLCALLAIRHGNRLSIWNHAFHTERLARQHDPKFGRPDQPGHFLLNGPRGTVFLAGDGRVLLPADSGSLWDHYMAGESAALLAAWLERQLGLRPTLREEAPAP